MHSRILPVLALIAALGLCAPVLGEDAAWPLHTRIGSGVSGHIHPAACVSRTGAVVVIYSQSDMKDLRITRSTDGGRTWTTPVPAAPTEKLSIYPGALTTLHDGRILHIWNTWYVNESGKKSRFAQYSLSTDDGATWSEARSLPKNPEAESVLRHPIVELSPTEWLCALMDKTVLFNPESGATLPFGDGRNHGLTPIVRTTKGTFVTGTGLRSTDQGKTWQKIERSPAIGENGWRFDLRALDNGWLVTQEVIGSGVGGNSWRFVVSRDDGQSWDFDGAVEFYNPGRPIGGRACPKTIQLDKHTIGTVFYDVDPNQTDGPGVFYFRTPLARLNRAAP